MSDRERYRTPLAGPSIWIGFDSREAAAFAVAVESTKRKLSRPLPMYGLVLPQLQQAGLYYRPTERRLGKLHDMLSVREDYNGQVSTEFSVSRFLTPILAGSGLALFMDCDVLIRADMLKLFDKIDRRYAVTCVKHDHSPSSSTKMDGQLQTAYGRKNWSSMMIFNCDHPANRKLTLELVNTVPGRDLHHFCWLRDEDIGELDLSWNWLVNESPPVEDPNIVHFTLGGPWFPAFEDVPFADEWREVYEQWAQIRQWAVKAPVAAVG